MNRRKFIIGAAGVGLATAFILKPGDGGASYSPYFRDLNDELMKSGPYRPSMLVDLDKLDQNIKALLQGLNQDINYRIVAKSLPSPGLLDYIMKEARTNKLMVFHQPFVNNIAENFPKADVLLGKPMSVRSAEIFYKTFSNQSGFDPSRQLQWLIDSEKRLIQYQDLAKKLNVKMRISIEIDVGLHRGGLQSPADLPLLLDRIPEDSDHLEFAGFMGYDPHVVKLQEDKLTLVRSKEYMIIDIQVYFSGTGHHLLIGAGSIQSTVLKTFR